MPSAISCWSGSPSARGCVCSARRTSEVVTPISGPGAMTLLDRIQTSRIGFSVSPVFDICPVEDLPPGEKRLVELEDLEIGVFNCNGRCTRSRTAARTTTASCVDGEFDPDECAVECPRHGSGFDLRTGNPLNLPAYVPVDTFPVSVADGVIRVEVD